MRMCESAEDALAQADVLLLAARALAAAGDPALLPRLDAEEIRSVANRLSALALGESLQAVVDGAALAHADELRAEHARLFEGAIACPINETAYVRRDKGMLLADICGFYRAFGFQPRSVTGEKPDHLVCELEFSAVLFVMLAQALHEPESERAEITSRAIAAFWNDHVMAWWSAFAQRLMEATAQPYLQRVADLHNHLCMYFVERYELRTASTALDPAGTDDEGTPYECGLAPAAPPLAQLGVPQVR